MEWGSPPTFGEAPRTIKKFLWLPQTINGVTKWWITTSWLQVVRRGLNDKNSSATWHWVNDCWL